MEKQIPENIIEANEHARRMEQGVRIEEIDTRGDSHIQIGGTELVVSIYQNEMAKSGYIASGKIENGVIELNLGINRFGRSEEIKFVGPKEQLEKVSRSHFEVNIKNDGTYEIRDLGSTNGTYLI